ncbi:MAG: hypothetical protein WB558_13580 [Terriglobales bacterium]
MFIPEDILSCVVFVGYRKADKSYRMAGTAFWIVRPMADDIRENFAYLVTAKHVIEHIRDKLGLADVYLRVNLKDGTLKWTKTKLSDWVLSGHTDVAAMQIGIPLEWEHSGWPMGGFAEEALIRSRRVGIGSEIFVAGMFSRRLGNRKNIPTVRIGNIASIPSRSELVHTSMGDLSAYLAEARSISGISGSPVFVDINGSLPLYRDRGPSFFLIGLMHGHYDVEELKHDDAIVDDGIQKQA